MIKVKPDPTYENLGLNKFMTRHLQPLDRNFKTPEDFSATHLDKSVVNDKILTVNTEKIRISPREIPAVHVFEIFYLGIVDIPLIVSGTVDGETYNSYLLQVYIHHNFSDFTDAVPFYDFWAYSNQYGREQKRHGALPIPSGAYGASEYHAAWRSQCASDIANNAEEVIFLQLSKPYTGTPFTITASTLQLYLALQYARDVNLLSESVAGQGGGGGILYERVNITL